MHELVQNEKKKDNENKKITRTGLDEEQDLIKKRIAARAAAAMAQVLQRNKREPRSFFIWGDRKKAIVKKYPDGRQEIIVPQTLTPEQEHYEFPPRSRFLKKLANSKAEQNRMNNQQNAIDELSLNEWFSSKTNDNKIIEWINQVERSTSKKKNYKIIKSATPTNYKIQLKSNAGKRWANNITSNTSLIPPDEGTKKHYIPRKLLKKTTALDLDDTISKIQLIWKEHNAKNLDLIENKISIQAMSSTGQRTPISSMVYLIQMLQSNLIIQQQKSNERLNKLESLLSQERQQVKSLMDELKLKDQQQQKIPNIPTSSSKRPTNNNSVKQVTGGISSSKKQIPSNTKPPTTTSSIKQAAALSKKQATSTISSNKRKISTISSTKQPPPSSSSAKPRIRTSSLANVGIKINTKSTTRKI